MRFRFHALFDRLQNVLLISFTLIAVVTFIVGIWTTSVIVNNYTERAENERVARDMNLAVAFYERSLIQIRGAAARLAGEPALAQQIEAIQESDQATQDSLGDLMIGELKTIYPAGTHFILIMDGEGKKGPGLRHPESEKPEVTHNRQLACFSSAGRRVVRRAKPGGHRGDRRIVAGRDWAGGAGVHSAERHPQGEPATL